MRTLIPLMSVLFLVSACATGGSPSSSGASSGASSGPAASTGQPVVQTRQGRCSVHSKRDCDWATRYQYYSPR